MINVGTMARCGNAMDAIHEIDGVDVHVDGSGNSSIVMLHGWPDTYRLWDAQVAAFGSRFTCVRFTLPGFDVDKPRRALSLAQMIGFLKSVVEQTCPGQKVILMLHDWGAFFGYQFALTHPALVSRIVGVDIGNASSARFKRSLSMKAKLMIFSYQVWLAVAWRIGGALGDRMTRFMARALRSPAKPQLVGSCMNYPYYITWTGACGSYKGVVEVAPTCPLLFIYGRRKPFMFHTSEWAAAIAAEPGNQVLGLQTGHWVMTENAAEFNRAVLAWLALRSNESFEAG